ncbi:hypothetical protein [Leptospira bandrabouensis]|uniref:hypothetical protein n=1 Tax=Leptospira bandrabouensis TaxID=2484903 RepID=UPI001EE818D7|nr:hypothetical protein [Leptospira bandrabouensis]MCG6146614.1 hypothetical protein [Leptospira bandrabouensis]MCG6161945.1 hypothetical protein [Leptospira bandrabouensis]MCG6166199.1 hypothetical protein [Leptospira bandrabouensis]
MYLTIEYIDLEDIAKLITAISTILWPIISLIVVLILKDDVKKLISKIRRGTFFGNEIELAEDIKQFEKTIENVEQRIPFQENKKNGDENAVSEIVNDSSIDPKIGLIRLAIEIEKQLREIMFTTGWHTNIKRYSVHESFAFLTTNGVLPKNILSSLKIFWDLRSKIIHGSNSINNDEIIRIIDIGLVLLNAINAIPREINIVYQINIQLYSDENCTIKNMKGFGLMLETTSPGKTTKTLRIFPTNLTNYEIGKCVTWEWSFDNVWDKCFYIHPDTNEKTLAWSQSAEFIGRHIENI